MTITDKIMDLSVVWKQAAMMFPHFHRCGVDWDGAYREFLEQAAHTQTELEHALLVAEFVNLLGDGHTDLSFSKRILDEAGYLPFAMEYVDGAYYAEGERILGFNGKPVQEILSEAFRYVYHVGNFVPRLRYILPFLLNAWENTLETGSGSKTFTMLTQRPAVRYQQDAEFYLHGDILRIKIDDMLRDRAPQVREKLLQERPRAVILDIRENIGGMTQYGANIAQLFLSGKFGGCQKWTRTMTGVEYASASQIVDMTEKELRELMSGENAREEIEKALRIANLSYFQEYEDCWGCEDIQAVFDGPMVLLTSRKTVSAAEDFTAFFRTNQRAAIIGTPTCGTSGTPLLQTLSCGTARICSVGYRLLDGTEFIGKGIEPDILAEPTSDDIRQGRDTVLLRALDYLA